MKKNFCLILKLLLGVLMLSATVYAQDISYRYQLEEGKGKAVCEHMTAVFNEKFKMPWGDMKTRDKGLLVDNANPIIYGKPMDQIFKRLKGVEFRNKFAWDMMYSKYPASSEFDAVDWKEGRYTTKQSRSRDPHGTSLLVAKIDIDNDGKEEWVLKYTFMYRRPIYSKNPDETRNYAGWENIRIFPASAFSTQDFTRLQFEKILDVRNPRFKHRILSIETGQMIRPFVYTGKTYLLAYVPKWGTPELRAKQRSDAPPMEYFKILHVTQGGYLEKGEKIETPNTVVDCVVRMIPF